MESETKKIRINVIRNGFSGTKYTRQLHLTGAQLNQSFRMIT